MTVRYTVAAPPEPATRDVWIARLWAAGAIGVWERGPDVVAWFTGATGQVPGDGTWEQEPERDWQAIWKAGIEPVVVGDVAVVPSWLRGRAPDVRHVIELDPGQAFGTGHHATTVLCLELLQDVAVADATVLDVGTGTGVLGIAARLLGARCVRAVDVDPGAVEVARANAAANGVELELAGGSVRDADRGRYDLVLANLLTDTVTALAGPLASALAAGGALIASGITPVRAEGPCHALAEAGLVVVREEQRDGWVGLVARHGVDT